MSKNEDFNSIKEFGLTKVFHKFTPDILMERIRHSEKVTMLIIRNATFFTKYADELKELIIKNDFKFTAVMLNPASFVPRLLTGKFGDLTEHGLTKSIKDVINNILRENIFVDLPVEKRGNIRVKLSDIFPAYSGYIFDDNEMWFSPYFFRPSRMPVPIFIFNDAARLKGNEIFLDIRAMENELTFEHDLNTIL